MVRAADVGATRAGGWCPCWPCSRCCGSALAGWCEVGRETPLLVAVAPLGRCPHRGIAPGGDGLYPEPMVDPRPARRPTDARGELRRRREDLPRTKASRHRPLPGRRL